MRILGRASGVGNLDDMLKNHFTAAKEYIPISALDKEVIIFPK